MRFLQEHLRGVGVQGLLTAFAAFVQAHGQGKVNGARGHATLLRTKPVLPKPAHSACAVSPRPVATELRAIHRVAASPLLLQSVGAGSGFVRGGAAAATILRLLARIAALRTSWRRAASPRLRGLPFRKSISLRLVTEVSPSVSVPAIWRSSSASGRSMV
jgi:hypothetical protein